MADEKKDTNTPSTGGNTGEGTPPKKKNTVEVDADVLKKIMDDQATMQGQIATLTEDNKILEDSVSQSRLDEAKGKRKVKALPRAHLKRLEGKLIISWESYPGNKVVKNSSTGRVVGEILKGKYHFLGGGDTGFIDQTTFTDSNDLVYVRIKRDLGEKVVVEFEDKKVYAELLEIHKDFINP